MKPRLLPSSNQEEILVADLWIPILSFLPSDKVLQYRRINRRLNKQAIAELFNRNDDKKARQYQKAILRHSVFGLEQSVSAKRLMEILKSPDFNIDDYLSAQQYINHQLNLSFEVDKETTYSYLSSFSRNEYTGSMPFIRTMSTFIAFSEPTSRYQLLTKLIHDQTPRRLDDSYYLLLQALVPHLSSRERLAIFLTIGTFNSPSSQDATKRNTLNIIATYLLAEYREEVLIESMAQLPYVDFVSKASHKVALWRSPYPKLATTLSAPDLSLTDSPSDAIERLHAVLPTLPRQTWTEHLDEFAEIVTHVKHEENMGRLLVSQYAGLSAGHQSKTYNWLKKYLSHPPAHYLIDYSALVSIWPHLKKNETQEILALFISSRTEEAAHTLKFLIALKTILSISRNNNDLTDFENQKELIYQELYKIATWCTKLTARSHLLEVLHLLLTLFSPDECVKLVIDLLSNQRASSDVSINHIEILNVLFGRLTLDQKINILNSLQNETENDSKIEALLNLMTIPYLKPQFQARLLNITKPLLEKIPMDCHRFLPIECFGEEDMRWFIDLAIKQNKSRWIKRLLPYFTPEDCKQLLEDILKQSKTQTIFLSPDKFKILTYVSKYYSFAEHKKDILQLVLTILNTRGIFALGLSILFPIILPVIETILPYLNNDELNQLLLPLCINTDDTTINFLSRLVISGKVTSEQLERKVLGAFSYTPLLRSMAKWTTLANGAIAKLPSSTSYSPRLFDKRTQTSETVSSAKFRV